MLDHPAVKRFIQLVDDWNAQSWGEILLWETLEGTRPKPFLFLPELAPEDLAALKIIRDELKVWPFCTMERWELIPLKEWCAFAKKNPADKVRDRLNEAL